MTSSIKPQPNPVRSRAPYGSIALVSVLAIVCGFWFSTTQAEAKENNAGRTPAAVAKAIEKLNIPSDYKLVSSKSGKELEGVKAAPSNALLLNVYSIPDGATKKSFQRFLRGSDPQLYEYADNCTIGNDWGSFTCTGWGVKKPLQFNLSYKGHIGKEESGELTISVTPWSSNPSRIV